jgi:hypothetical protein
MPEAICHACGLGEPCADPDCPNAHTPAQNNAAPPAATKPSNPKDALGIKKASLSCVPAPVLFEVGIGMQEGACKYGRHNYRAIGVRGSVYYDAAMRHLMSWWEGEDIDPDSGLNHITKAITSLIVLRDAMIQNKFSDDRPPKSEDWLNALNAKAEALNEKYPSPVAPYTNHNTP